MSNRKYKNSRAKFRKKLSEKYKPVYNRREYKMRIKVHFKTLSKYLSQFHKYLDVYIKYNLWNYIRLCFILGRKRLLRIIDEKKEPTINEIHKIFKRLNLKREFENYFLNKTYLSYTINNNRIKCMHDAKRYNGEGTYNKFAEFVYLIIAEYIILHNYMWASGLKLKEIKSIDAFLKDIK